MIQAQNHERWILEHSKVYLVFGNFDGFFEDGPDDTLGAGGRGQTTMVTVVKLQVLRK